MVKKGKKGSKKKKKASAGAEKPVMDELKPVNEPPPYRDPVFDAPVAKIQI